MLLLSLTNYWILNLIIINRKIDFFVKEKHIVCKTSVGTCAFYLGTADHVQKYQFCDKIAIRLV